MRSSCPKCNGTGKIVSGKCGGCPEGQFETSEKTVMLDVEPGFRDGHHIVLEGASDEIPDHATGDVHFEIDTLPHASFKRVDDDLHYHIEVSLTEALVGIDRAVRQLDDRIIKIRTEGVTVPKQRIRIPGEGMPNRDGGSGDMIVHVWVDFPESLTDDQRAAVLKVHGALPKTEIGNGGGSYEPGKTNLTADSDEGVCSVDGNDCDKADL
eukprot:Plantae.Rhodophyta-Palmaria_palmata.ctg3410.p1 GENE.Plantae.Rhodophyta-Palmaria_palmata.ctg3410~~Plantae.Rhodophyta-Palmaria_palmata.ctg3410.p1  ORF type:complete len:210 (+),score=41.92 Plantae.Rhodophyta-Palmaria_palmata.ctg3410:90-719(+)